VKFITKNIMRKASSNFSSESISDSLVFQKQY